MVNSKGNAYLHCLQREEAWARWRRALEEEGFFAALPEEEIAAAQALGRVAARTVRARRSVPHYNGSAMDGYAVCAEDTYGAGDSTPLRLRLAAAGPVPQGGCVRVDTGDPLPLRADAVVMVEDVHEEGGEVEIIAAAAPWQHVRVIGEDTAVGDVLLTAGEEVTPAHVALLLAAGVFSLPVVRRPRVAVLPTGSELAPPEAVLAPGDIPEVNSHLLAALVQQWGGVAARGAILPDEPRTLRDAVAAALADNDIVVLNAGTSAGRDDYTARVLGELGRVLCHGVAIRPGKPVVLAVCAGKAVLGLPGYPGSAQLTAELFLAPLLALRAGRLAPPPLETEAFLSRTLASPLGVEEYVRVAVAQLEGRPVAVPLARGAGRLSTLSKASGYLAVDAARDGLPAGSAVRVRLARPQAPEGTLLAVGSHDMALELLGAHLRPAGLSVVCAHVGSLGGVQAIQAGEAHLAGIHLLDEASGTYNLPLVRRRLTKGPWKLVRLARREQGLIVPAGNPRGLTSLAQLADGEVRFINRQRGAGTRLLLDHHLRLLGLGAKQLRGYEREVGTHMAVAASVAAGAADAGLGIRAAARALGLDFVPLAFEEYDLLLRFAPGDVREGAVLQALASPAFRAEVEALGGYDAAEAGRVLAGWEGA